MEKAVNFADSQRKKQKAAAKRADKEAQNAAALEAVLLETKHQDRGGPRAAPSQTYQYWRYRPSNHWAATQD